MFWKDYPATVTSYCNACEKDLTQDPDTGEIDLPIGGEVEITLPDGNKILFSTSE